MARARRERKGRFPWEYWEKKSIKGRITQHDLLEIRGIFDPTLSTDCRDESVGAGVQPWMAVASVDNWGEEYLTPQGLADGDTLDPYFEQPPWEERAICDIDGTPLNSIWGHERDEDPSEEDNHCLLAEWAEAGGDGELPDDDAGDGEEFWFWPEFCNGEKGETHFTPPSCFTSPSCLPPEIEIGIISLMRDLAISTREILLTLTERVIVGKDSVGEGFFDVTQLVVSQVSSDNEVIPRKLAEIQEIPILEMLPISMPNSPDFAVLGRKSRKDRRATSAKGSYPNGKRGNDYYKQQRRGGRQHRNLRTIRF